MPLPNLSLKCQPKCSLICVSRSALIVAACAAVVAVVVIVWLHYYCSVAAACGVCAQSLIMNSARLALAAAHASCQLDTASHTSLLSLSLCLLPLSSTIGDTILLPLACASQPLAFSLSFSTLHPVCRATAAAYAKICCQ